MGYLYDKYDFSSAVKEDYSGRDVAYKAEIRHNGLNKYRLIRGKDLYVVQQMAELQIAAWEEQWAKKKEKTRKAQQREEKLWDKERKLEEATECTAEAQEIIKSLENTLQHTLVIHDAIVWDALKDYSEFKKPKPQPPQLLKAELLDVPPPPKETDPKYQPQFNFFDMTTAKRQKKIDAAKAIFQQEYDFWINQKAEVDKKNEYLKAGVDRENTKLEMQYQNELKQWELDKQMFLEKQKGKNDAIDKRKEQYHIKLPDSILDYCELVLSRSEYPDYFPQEFELDYNPETKILVVDYSLPSIDKIPRLKEAKYVQSRDQFTEVFLSESAFNKLYDSLIYQISLRTVHELYEADVINAIESIVFNGWVLSIDKATGQSVNACILSVQGNRQEFLSINLANVDPKICFKNLKGVGSSKLHSLTPVAPILNINREDKRFVSSYQVANGLDESYNLAAMDWEDFEHLIRELFEKEFAQAGGEVKITQASRDGGVDAVAFDPDPIRGGKIVIQAKRYTNTVGVSAVRDLYGTVINEGATKGILVTTSDYGPDTYEFIKGKPLTLLSGSNLLHLLEKHGHKAKIDLKEAKQLLSDREK